MISLIFRFTCMKRLGRKSWHRWACLNRPGFRKTLKYHASPLHNIEHLSLSLCLRFVLLLCTISASILLLTNETPKKIHKPAPILKWGGNKINLTKKSLVFIPSTLVQNHDNRWMLLAVIMRQTERPRRLAKHSRHRFTRLLIFPKLPVSMGQ